jgi:hypothetical protein
MAHELTPREEEPEAQAAGGRYGSPPRKPTAIGFLDPPAPPKKRVKFLAVIILVGLALVAALMIWKLF